jgi:hypothetical protein
MPIWDHLEELRERVLVGLLAAGVAIGGCFCFSKELVLFLEAPVADAGVRFLQLSPGEFFFTTFKVRTPLGGTAEGVIVLPRTGPGFEAWGAAESAGFLWLQRAAWAPHRTLAGPEAWPQLGLLIESAPEAMRTGTQQPG